MASNPASPNGHDEDLTPVQTPSGSAFWVYGREKKYWNDRVKRYLTDNHFTNVADLQVLDRIIMLELFCWRYGLWQSQQEDYWHEPVDEAQLGKMIKEASGELRQLVQTLGIDKVSRDKVRGEDSVAKYIENLKIRAREFGVMRENQLGKALELMAEIKARVTLYDQCTPEERREMQCDIEHLLDWMRTVAFPDYDAIDEHFRTNSQRFWIREQ
jgi:hypothetical protein